MSDYVEFTPDGLIVHKWNGKKRKFIQKKPKKLTIITHLRSRCVIAEGTTLGQIFDAVDKYKLLKMVISQYSWCRQLESFHAQAKERRYVENQEEIQYLELYHHPEVYKTTETKKHPGGTRERTIVVDFNTSIGFHGIGIDSNGSTINYSVSYNPMWELVDLPVKLNKTFDVYEPLNLDGVYKKPEKLLTSTREFTLLEVLDAIYWDISFMGGPEENAEFIDQMSERIDQIENGNIPMIPIEQVFTEMKDQESDVKILMHPDVAEFFGCDPNSIPLDDKEIIRKDEKEE
jgi:hypothetical protein